MTHPSRRAAMGWAASAVTALSLSRARPALAQSDAPTRSAASFRAVAVDTTAMARRGDGSGAANVAHALAPQMRVVFGDLLSPGDAVAPTLLARVNSVYLTSYAGTRSYGRHGGDGDGDDALDGAGVVIAGGRAVSETPILAVLDPGYSGAWYLPNIDELRIASICHQFAWWLRREMGV